MKKCSEIFHCKTSLKNYTEKLHLKLYKKKLYTSQYENEIFPEKE